MGFRAHFDISLGDSEQYATNITNALATAIADYLKKSNDKFVVQFRLAHDDDRNVRNYLSKDENGHVSTKKSRIET